MGRIVLWMSVSVDGYFEGPNREIDWHRVDEELHTHFNETLAGAGAFLDGRRTWELMAGYWPVADADPGCAPVTAEFARIWRDMPKVVYSRTLTSADWNTTARSQVDPDEVRALAGRSGGDLILGGADLAATFLRLDLIDEVRLYVHPVVLGGGHPLFRPGTTLDLRLLETRAFGNGVVLLRYGRS